jgi:hypothetical protein
MAQDLLKISREKFELQLSTISFGTLKNLAEEIFVLLKNEAFKSLDLERVKDLERKQTLILKEMKLRGKLNNKMANNEYMNWLYSRNKKRVF